MHLANAGCFRATRAAFTSLEMATLWWLTRWCSSRLLGSVAERMDTFDVFLTMVITGALVSSACDTILERSSQVSVERGSRTSDAADVVLAASRLRDGGVFVRMAGGEH